MRLMDLPDSMAIYNLDALNLILGIRSSRMTFKSSLKKPAKSTQVKQKKQTIANLSLDQLDSLIEQLKSRQKGLR